MKKTNVFRKIGTALLAAVMAFGLVGCGNKAKGGGKLSDVEIWGAPATEKVLRDKNGIYDDFKTDAAIDLLKCSARISSPSTLIIYARVPSYSSLVQKRAAFSLST